MSLLNRPDTGHLDGFGSDGEKVTIEAVWPQRTGPHTQQGFDCPDAMPCRWRAAAGVAGLHPQHRRRCGHEIAENAVELVLAVKLDHGAAP